MLSWDTHAWRPLSVRPATVHEQKGHPKQCVSSLLILHVPVCLNSANLARTVRH